MEDIFALPYQNRYLDNYKLFISNDIGKSTIIDSLTFNHKLKIYAKERDCYLIKENIIFYLTKSNMIEITDISNFQLQKIKSINLENYTDNADIFKVN